MHFNDILFIFSAIGFNMSGFMIGVYFANWYWKTYKLKGELKP